MDVCKKSEISKYFSELSRSSSEDEREGPDRVPYQKGHSDIRVTQPVNQDFHF